MVDQTPVTIRDCFDAHGYSTGTGRSSTRSTCGVIRTICGDAGHYVIMLDRRRGFVLDKSRFLSGDPEAFASFWSAVRESGSKWRNERTPLGTNRTGRTSAP